MIEYVTGGLAELSPATAIIDCNGLGYAVNISLNTYSAIQGKKECRLYIYEAIREDAHVLFGSSPPRRNASCSCCSSAFPA